MTDADAESEIDTVYNIDVDLVDKESIRIRSQTVQDDNSRTGIDFRCDDADIKPIYDEEQWLTKIIKPVETAVTTSNELDLLFGPLFDEYFNGENQVVLKSSAVTTTDASNKRQQQPDSTSSTSTLAITVTANGNFDL
ncbi:hypothetical protein Tco_0577623 [Tanacetum coccineum]